MKIIKYSRCGGWILRIVSFAIDLTFFTGGVLLIEPVTWAGGTVASATEASLRGAMSGGGTVTFACDGTITLGNTITNALDTVLDGSGHQIIISGSGWRRVFFVSSNANFTVSNLTIATGASDNGAGIYNAGGHLAVRNCVFMYNTAIGQAGSNYSNPGSNGCGGAIFNAGVAMIANSTFSTNTAAGGRGGYGLGVTVVTGGSGGLGGSGYGGAIYNSGELTLTNCTLIGNAATGGTGGSGGNGGAAGGTGGTGGAGGSSYGGTLLNGGVIRVANTTFTGNASTGGSGGQGGDGGGYGFGDGSNGGNGSAGGTGSGGGIYDLTGHCFLTNCTLAFNSAIAGGGGAGGSGTYGSAGGGSGSNGLPGPGGSANGGGIKANGGPFLINTLLAFNAPANGSGSVTDGGHNISSDNSCGFPSVGSLNNTNPLLGPLMDNGGPTLTMALLAGSPAIDAGDNGAAPPADQRGVPRPIGLVSDIGAYECGPLAIVMAPQNQGLLIGSTVDFSTIVVGYPPLHYQWFYNGTNALDGATNSLLELANLKVSQSGLYAVVVTNLFGSVTSSPAMLDVYSEIVTTCTEGALRAAMGLTRTVTFACNGTIMLSNTIAIGTDIAIDGSGHQITISGGNTVRGFYVATNVNFTVVNLTIANGRSTNGAGIFNDGGALVLEGATFLSNVATNGALSGTNGGGCGGAILSQSGLVNAHNCTFSGNAATQWTVPYLGPAPFPQTLPGLGGAIYNRSGSVFLQNCLFVGNEAAGAACGPIGYPLNQTAGGDGCGGAVYNADVLNTSECSFLLNTADGGPGFDYGYNYTPAGSRAGCPGGSGKGGAICNLGLLSIDRCLFASNTAAGGTGGHGENGYTQIPYYAYDGAKGGSGGDGVGGALYTGGTATVVNCTFAWNADGGGSGGIGGDGGSIWYQGAHFWGYGGQGGNGGNGFGVIYNTNGLFRSTNCTIAFNSSSSGSGAPGGAGRAQAAPGANGTTRGSVIVAGGGMLNTLLVMNSPSNCSGTITDAGHNLSSDGSCAFTSAGSMNNTDPKLGPLADNGGPTLTMALLPGSPAINAGASVGAPTTDQRGVTRPQGAGVDIGAFEYLYNPVFLGAQFQTPASFWLQMISQPSQTNTLQITTNLFNWSGLTNVVAGSNGMCEFFDCSLGNCKARFYRLKSVTP